MVLKYNTENGWKGHVFKGKNNDTFISIIKLGSGSYATVWLCYYKNKNKLMAIKIFDIDEHKSANKEIANYKKINDLGVKNTVKLYDVIKEGDNICLIFDLMLGSLFDIMNNGVCSEKKFRDGFPLNFVIAMTRSVLETLVDLHKNKIIHGDIKPENILLYGKSDTHCDILRKLSNKTSTKRIIDTIMSQNNILSDSSDESSSDESSSDGNSRIQTDESEMSNEPELIEPDNSDNSNSDNEPDSGHEHDTQIIISEKYIEQPSFMLSDLGSCVDISLQTVPKSIQTKYYRSPEVLLGLEYGTPCDIWALGCTIYELITSDILFDPDEYNIDQKRSIMHLIYNYVGKFPNKLTDKSQYKDVFYTDTYILKGHLESDIEKKNIWTTFLEKIKCQKNRYDNIKKYLLVDLLLEMLTPDPYKRITAIDALRHPLFAFCDTHHSKK